MSYKDDFVYAIYNKVMLNITFNSCEKGVITRKCVPYDYGPSKKYKDGIDRYHFEDLDSPSGSHVVSIKPEQIVRIEITNETFEPGDYVKWKPNWYLKRDWGKYS